MVSSSSVVLFSLVFGSSVLASPSIRYNLQENYVGDSFLDGFNWDTYDPTGSHVNYLDQATAISKNLTYTSGNKFLIRADYTNVVQPGSRRDSIRITSKNDYTESAIVFDVSHMPEGCATWPAFWMLTTQGWPSGGEIDIIEGINLQSGNLASLHTTGDCKMPPNRKQTGIVRTTNCDASVNGNSGCGSQFGKPNSYGRGLNSVGGGWFVVTRSNTEGINMYFWDRHDKRVPAAVRNGGAVLAPDPTGSWGEPEAAFPADLCNFSEHFTSQRIIINIALCGPWINPRFNSDGCGPGSCDDFVDKNPSEFQNAYWEINALRMYVPEAEN